MDCFDKVEELLLAEGYTKEEIPAIMVSLVEQGFDPTGVFLGGLANMLGFLPKKKDAKPKMPDIRGGNNKVDGYGKPKVVKPTTTTPSWGPKNARGATQPNFVTGSGKINQAVATGKGQPWMVKLDPVPAASSKLPQPPKPPTQAPGQMRIPGLSSRAQELRNVTGNPNTGLPGGGNTGLSMSGGSNAMRNRSIFRGQSLRTAPPIPTGPVAKPPALTGALRNLRNIRGGLASTALNMATAGALDNYVVKPAGKALGDALARGILDVTGHGERARQVQPSLYGKSGPDLTPDIVRGVQQRSKLAQQRAETQAASQPKPQQTGERSAAANAAKQETAKAEAQRRRVSAADFDRTFAAARANLKQQGKDPNSGTFSWRGKSYSTKLK